MTREEQIRQASIKYTLKNKPKFICGDMEDELNRNSAFEEGAKWADEHPNLESLWQKQEIDWEKRRYEIAKEMMPIIYWQGMEAQKHGQSVKRKDTVYYAVIFADMLIEELKKGGEK